MSTWWNSLDKLSRLNTWVLALAATFGFLAAVFVVASWFTGTRVAALQDRELERYKSDAGIKIANANEMSARANERAGKLEKEAADLTTKNLELEAAISPRRLTRREQSALASLTGFAGQTVEIKSYSSDTEGLILATQVLDALSKAGIRVQDNRLTMQPAGSVVFGISVDGSERKLVAALRNALSRDGSLMASSTVPSPGLAFSVSFGAYSGGPPPGAIIVVGAKPLR